MEDMSLTMLTLLVVGGLCIVFLSFPAWRAGWKHAGPRSLAFLAIPALLLLNLEAWVLRPFEARQLLSWVLLMASVGLALPAFVVLRRHGHPQGSIDFTTSLVTASVYRFLRHPLYASLICLAWGTLLKRVVPSTIILAAAATLLLFATAKLEEAFNFAKFGPPNADYVGRTKMFVPLLI
jgi:protein-S-isoprenylcysteine O-methyltransferase Ste14